MTRDVPARVVVVSAAIIERDGLFLVTRRPTGAHLEGYWEFPGGKCEPDETHTSCLEREIREELDVGASVGTEVFSTAHSYGDRVIELHFFGCELCGEPRAALGQEMRWVRREELAVLRFPPADLELIERLLQHR